MDEMLDWRVDAASIPAAGRAETRAATPQERGAIAAALDLVACDRLEADYKVMRLAGERVRLHGTLTADVVQTCVVSLEPVPAHVEGRFDVTFWPEGGFPEPGGTLDPEAIVAESTPEDEPIVDGALEVGRIVYETLAISLEPYPRKPGAELDPEQLGPGRTGEAGPFAALARLKQQQG